MILAKSMRSPVVRQAVSGSHRQSKTRGGPSLVALGLAGLVVVGGASENAVSSEPSYGSLSFEEFKQPLGQGSFGLVRKARCLTTQEPLAVKMIEETKRNQHVISSEVDNLKLIKDAGGHKNIVAFKDMISPSHTSPINLVASFFNAVFGKITEETPNVSQRWLVFEHVEGEELYDRCINEGPMNEKEASKLFAQIARAVNFLHERVGLVHGDIKPENVLVTPKNTVKLIDFGSALRTEEESSIVIEDPSKPTSTAAYMAPEMISRPKDEDLTTACDIFSLGCVLYICLSCRHPFDQKGNRSDVEVMRSVLSEEVSFDAREFENVKESTKDLIRKMLNKDPQNRISLREILEHPFVKSL